MPYTRIVGDVTTVGFVTEATEGADTLYGTSGVDEIYGYGGPDVIYAGAGDDVIDGGAGSDWLDGGSGGDAFIGGEGTDTVSYGSAELGVTLDLATGSRTNDAVGDTFIDIEKFYGSAFSDIFIAGRGSSIHFNGAAGDDWLFGSGGNAILNGADGDDILNGGQNDDVLMGGSGHNILTGDPADHSEGADLFVVTKGSTNIITDFDVEHDKIMLVGFDASAFGPDGLLGWGRRAANEDWIIKNMSVSDDLFFNAESNKLLEVNPFYVEGNLRLGTKDNPATELVQFTNHAVPEAAYAFGWARADNFLFAATEADALAIIESNNWRNVLQQVDLNPDLVWESIVDSTFDVLLLGDEDPVSDLDGDLTDDVLFQSAATGQVYFAKMVDGAFHGWGAATGVLGTNWKAVGSGDVNPGSAGGAEVFVQQQSTGAIYYASSDTGATTWGVVSNSLTADWKLRAVADVNGDGSADAVVQDEATGTIYFADMQGGTFQGWGVVSTNLTADWKAVGAADINNDGSADVVVQQQSTGTTYYADMAGGTFSGWKAVASNLTAEWQVKAVGDVTGDGFADVVFQQASTGTAYYADMANGTFAHWGVVAGNVDANWKVESLADVDSDGDLDAVLQNATNGATYYAEMGASGFEGWGVVATNISTEWQVV